MASSSTAIIPTRTPASSIHQQENETRALFSDTEVFPHANTRSTIDQQTLLNHRTDFHFPGEYLLSIPKPDERMYWKPSKPQIAVPTQVLRNGVRFPLHPFISGFLGFVGIGLAQLVPNSYIHLVCFIAHCKNMNLEPSMDFFFHIFSLTKTKEHGYRALSRLPNQRAWMVPPSSNKGWHNQWFYVSGPDTHLIQTWGNAEKPPTDPISDARKKLFRRFCKQIPTDPWDLNLLNNQQWLFDHGLVTIYKSNPNIVRPLLPAEPSLQASPDLPEKSALDMTDLEKQQLRKRKKRKLTKAPPVISPPSPLPSPPSSPSPSLGEQGEILPARPHPSLPPIPQPIEIDSDPSPKQTEPHLSPIRRTLPDAEPSSSSHLDPFPNISLSLFNQLSFFPTEPISYLPMDLFNFFNLPADNSHYNTTDPDALLTTTSLHLGQALGGFSRLLNLRNKNKEESDKVSKLQAELSLLQSNHDKLHNDHATLLEEHIGTQEELSTQLVQAEVTDSILNGLQTQLAEETYHNRSLQEKLLNLTTERTWLLEERTARAIRTEDLIAQNKGLEQKIQTLTDDCSSKDKTLEASVLANRRLMEENDRLKNQAQGLSEDHQTRIIEEYKRSSELTEAVMDQYNQGYMFAKKMVADAGVNPITLGFSSDEEEEEDPQIPPRGQTPSEGAPLQEDPPPEDQTPSEEPGFPNPSTSTNN